MLARGIVFTQVAMFTRLDKLQEENKRLKEELSIAKVEAAKLKKLIVGNLLPVHELLFVKQS